MSRVRPPSVGEWLLRQLRPSPDTAYLAGDLAEGFEKRAARNPGAARRWYWSQVLRSVRHRSPQRVSDARRSSPVATLLEDVLAARHVLTRRRGWVSLVVATIAASVTAASTLVGVTYSVLYRPLPWPGAARIVRVWETRDGGLADANRILSSVTLNAWRDRAKAVDELASYRELRYTVQGPQGAESIRSVEVSSNLLSMLGAVPAAGRTLGSSDVDAVVISDRLARRQFGGDQSAIGRTLDRDGWPCIVVGVLPENFGFPSANTDVWFSRARNTSTGVILLSVIARLAHGVTTAQAAAEGEAWARSAQPLARSSQAMLFGADGAPRLHVASLLDVEVGGVRPAILASLAGVALLLATAIVSLAGLQLARTAERRQELAIRAAMGAGRVRIVMLLGGELVWLGLAGGGLALVLTWWILDLAPRLLPADFPRVAALTFDATSIVAVAATTIATTLLAGILPAWQAARLNPTATRLSISRPHRLLPAAQIAVAVGLLVGAGLVTRTFVEWVREDLGYTPADLVMARLIGTGNIHIDTGTLQRVLARLGRVPGVTGVALADALPFQRHSGRMGTGFMLPARDGSGGQVPARASENQITASYFDLVGMRLIAGRGLVESDARRATRALVVNEAFARAYLGEHPLGTSFNRGEIVGIVEDIKDRGPGDPVDPQVFSLEDMSRGALLLYPAAILIRASGDSNAIIAMARDVVRSVDERLALGDPSTVQARLSEMVANPRLYAVVAGISAAFALVVAAVGLCGALWFTVNGRTREIGVRTVLGATPRMIACQVLADGVSIAAAGIVAGLAASALLVGDLSSLLYRVAPHDILVFTMVPTVVMVVATAASVIPARRAAAVNPIDALKVS